MVLRNDKFTLDLVAEKKIKLYFMQIFIEPDDYFMVKLIVELETI